MNNGDRRGKIASLGEAIKTLAQTQDKPPSGFVFCDEPWAPDQRGWALAWFANKRFDVHPISLLPHSNRWIRPAGVPVAELRALADELQDTDGVTAWTARQEMRRLAAKYEGGAE